jgi:hypothetical protein
MAEPVWAIMCMSYPHPNPIRRKYSYIDSYTVPGKLVWLENNGMGERMQLSSDE